MRHLISKVLLTACCAFVGCESRSNPEVIDSGWAVCKLDKFWLFNAPQGTKVIYDQGIDSTPGRIILATNDSVRLEFDSGFEMSFRDTVCNLGSEAIRAKRQIARGDYKYLDKPDTIHQAEVDTINGRIATIITPLKTGGGTTKISISDCASHRWLGIYGRNIPSDKQELVLKIYRSIRQESSK
jgi:hypothetical protein